MAAPCTDHFTLWNLGPPQLCVDFQGGQLVADAGLLAVRALERPLHVLADLALLLPDPRSPKFVHHSVESAFSPRRSTPCSLAIPTPTTPTTCVTTPSSRSSPT